jgi:uncharacterized protein (DUF1778 family)
MLRGALLLALTSLPAPEGGIGAELAELYRSDQADQAREDLGAEFGRRQKVRRDRVIEIVRAGELDRPIDYYHASMLLQHGDGVDDFLLAHVLATAAAFDGEKQGFFLSAATLDRFLTRLKRPQRFGSQSFDPEGKDLGDVSRLLSEAIVQVFRQKPPYPRSGLNGRPIDPKVRTRAALQVSGRKLAQAAKNVESQAKTKPEAVRPIVEAALEIVDRGLLEQADDFCHAALVLAHGQDADELLLSHVLATAAGLLRHKQARALWAATLDRFLEALGRPPLFEPPAPAGEKPRKGLTLPDNVRAKFRPAAAKR